MGVTREPRVRTVDFFEELVPVRPKILGLVLVVLMSVMLAGCGGGGDIKADAQPPVGQGDEQGPSQEVPEVANPPEDTLEPKDERPVQVPPEGEKKGTADSRTSVGGIYLWDSPEDVEKVLGKDRRQIFVQEEGYYGESQFIWQYDEGIEIVIGVETRKVLDIVAYSPTFATNLGAKVGDRAGDVVALYRSRYKEPQSRHGAGILEGWFEVEDGAYLIFDFNRDDGTYINQSWRDDDKVEVIKLTHSFYMD